MPLRTESDEKYILDLAAEVLAEPDYRWQHRFPTLLGDPGLDGRQRPLPVDGYFPRHRLVVEYWEKQHSAPVPIMDESPTVSGVSKGDQRRLYDQRRAAWAEANGLRFVILDYRGFETDPGGRLRRDLVRDRQTVAEALRAAGVLIEPGRERGKGTAPPEKAEGGCSICRLVHRERTTPAPSVLWESREEIAFLDPFPVLYGSTLVAPVRHCEQVTGDLTLHQFLAVQRVVYAVAEAVRLALKPDRVYLLAPGCMQAHLHLCWQVAPCPPGAPLAEQLGTWLDRERWGTLQLDDDEVAALAAKLQLHLPAWMRKK